MRKERFCPRNPLHKGSVIGEIEFDNAMSTIRDEGIGHIGKYYWLPQGVKNPKEGNI